ncbi:MAG: substrate-binding domain-containing protein, partial [Spirochaetia bacterium]
MKNTLLIISLILFTDALLFAGGFREEKKESKTAEPHQETQADGQERIKEERVKLATTTSTENSGLLDYLLPEFTADTKYKVDVISVGTGAALEMGKNGDVDVVLVHAKEQEEAFVEEGYGLSRKDVMYNDFVLLGPEGDPADITSADSAPEALSRISEAEAEFISRGDNSGTHIKELSVWDSAGITPSGSWYKEAGQGMGAVITMAEDQLGYTLSDRGTFISMRDNIELEVLYEGDSSLFNPYGIIAVNPERHEHINYDGAEALADWMVDDNTQELIADFRMD